MNPTTTYLSLKIILHRKYCRKMSSRGVEKEKKRKQKWDNPSWDFFSSCVEWDITTKTNWRVPLHGYPQRLLLVPSHVVFWTHPREEENYSWACACGYACDHACACACGCTCDCIFGCDSDCSFIYDYASLLCMCMCLCLWLHLWLWQWLWLHLMVVLVPVAASKK